MAALLSLLGFLPVFAQEESAAVFRSDSRLVVLHATVLDEGGRLVTGLPGEAFHVFENGVRQEIKVFRQEDAPVSMGLVVDDSASMLDKREKVKSAALALVRASNPEDEVFIVNFNEKTYLDTDFTNDITALEKGLSRIDSRGTTAMRDAVRLSIEHLARKGREDKKVLLVITDGEDNSSGVSRDYVVKMAQQQNVLVYALGLLGEATRDQAARARRDLDALAKSTGAQAYYLDDISEVSRVTKEIAHHVRNQYTLAYTPTNPALDGSYRQIRIAVDNVKAVTVRARTGYHAIPSAPALTGSTISPRP
jgi:VWFA-related protein